MQINVTCEKHNVSMVVVREWSSRGDIEVTVEPCSECIEEAAQQSVHRMWTKRCPNCAVLFDDEEMYKNHACAERPHR